MKKKVINFLKQNGFLLLILSLGAALRFYRLPEMASFDFDQEYASNFAYSVLREFPVQMIGQGLSVQGLFMGPWYFYFLVPFFLIFKLHPVGGTVGSVVLGLVIIIAYYYFGGKLFGKTAGLIGAFLRAVLYSHITADWAMVPAYSCELLVLITWYYFYQYWNENTKYLPLLGLVFGLYTSFHPILFPFYLVFLILVITKRIWPKPKTLFLSAVAFIIPLTPLILFEYFHRFLEVKLLLNLFFNSKAGQSSLSIIKFSKFLNIVFEGPQLLLGFDIKFPYFLSGIILLVTLILTIKKISIWKNSFHFFVLCITILIFLLYYYFFPTHVPEYYFMAPVALLLFYLTAILGYLFTKPVFKWVVIGFLIYVTFINFRVLKGHWFSSGLISLANKDNIVKAIIEKQPKNKDFFVSYINLPGWNFGFNYLFKVYNRIPKDKAVNNYIYTIVSPKELSPDSINFSSGNIGLILPKVAL